MTRSRVTVASPEKHRGGNIGEESQGDAVDTREPALKTLIRDRHLTYESFCREWDRIARSVDDHLRAPARSVI